jgi:hypothetical protein
MMKEPSMPSCRTVALLSLASFAVYGEAPLNDVTPFALTLRDATPIRLALTRALAFEGAKAGDNVDFEVLDDLRIDGVLVIGRGAIASGTMTVAEPATRKNKGGKLGVILESIPLSNGGKSAIRATKDNPESGPTDSPPISAQAPVKPATPSSIFTFGKDESFPEGTRITAYINGETKLDASRFLVDMAFSSSPQGALVSMYGTPIGRTPFTTKLAPGVYKTIFSANGSNLIRSVSVGPGHSNTVSALFEGQP